MRIERLAEEAGCTELQVWTLVELARGRSIEDVARDRGVLARGVRKTRDAAARRISKYHGIPLRDHAAESARQREDIIKLRLDGHSLRYIAMNCGASFQYVNKVCKDEQITALCIPTKPLRRGSGSVVD